MSKKKYFVPLIISGFPGVGKSHTEKEYLNKESQVCIDFESTEFKYLVNKNEDKCIHPNWPANYINSIKSLSDDSYNEYPNLKYIFITSHKEVLQGLVNATIPFIIVAPEYNLKDEYIERYKERGNDRIFIKHLSENWNTYHRDLESAQMPIIYLKSNEYLVDIFNKYSYFDLLEMTAKADEEVFHGNW